MKKKRDAPIKYGSAPPKEFKQRTTQMAMQTREVSLSRSQIVAQIAAHLNSLGEINDNQDIRNIDFGNMNDDIVKLKLKISTVKEGKVITLANGKKKP